MAKRITEHLARTAKLPKGKSQVLIWDTEVKGFGLRVTAKQASFIQQVSLDGSRKKRITIGRWPEWHVDEARERARRLKHDDIPLERPKLVADAWKRYAANHLTKLARKTAHDRKRAMETFVLPAIGKKALADVTTADIEDIHRAIAAPYVANRTLEAVSRLFNLAVKWGWCERNPAKGVERHRETPRASYLGPDEIARLMSALPDTESGDLLRVALLTGCRISEATSMAWNQIKAGVWTKPAQSVKQRREHRVPISEAAMEVIDRQPRRGPIVFTRPSGEPIRDVRKTWAFALKRAGLDPIRIHDARHSFASVLATQGVSLQVIGALLGHSTPSTTNRYAHLQDSALKRAAEAVVTEIGEARAPR
jgi:integrase